MMLLYRTRIPLIYLAALMIASTDAAAQRSSLNCPPPFRAERMRSSGAVPGKFFELGVGAAYPFRYTNSGGAQTASAESFSYHASPLPYITFTAHLVYRDRLTLFTGGEVTGSSQGLRFAYDNSEASLRNTRHDEAVVIRLSLGAGYLLTPRFKIYAGPYIAYSSHQGTSITSRVSGTQSAAYPPDIVQWNTPDEKSRFIPGLRVGLQYQLGYRLMANAIFNADFAQSGNSEGTVLIGNAPRQYGVSQPYLFYTGLTLGYRLFIEEGD